MRLHVLGLMLIFAGIALIIIAPLILAIMTAEGVKFNATGVGCIVLFFIPICFGYGEPLLIITLMVLAVVLIVVFLIVFRLLLRDLQVETTHAPHV
jgi:uncharacterized membrane protein